MSSYGKEIRSAQANLGRWSLWTGLAWRTAVERSSDIRNIPIS
jgi:hypothetical protein